MITPETLQNLGNKLADEYLQKQASLTKGLEKVASEYNLNKHQVHRVAEAANIKTHLELLKTAGKEAYIEFPVADPTAITEFSVPDNLATRDDYEHAPSTLSKAASSNSPTEPDSGDFLQRDPNLGYHKSIAKLAA